jgi:glycerophosphoryl diester phosphodiesterase
MAAFDLQGHRGARGLKPENTFSGFELAFDVGVTTIETDVHLTRDGVVVLSHDPAISERLCRALPDRAVPPPESRPLINTLSLAQLRGYQADRNPDPARFPQQDAGPLPLAVLFAQRQGIDPYTVPTVADLFAFAEAYAGELGVQAGKSAAQRKQVQRIRFDLELKRVPFHPELIGDNFDGMAPALLEQRVVEAIHAAKAVGRSQVRSFDHRSVRAVRQLEPRLTAAILIAETAPVSPSRFTRQADAQVYCPHFRFLDQAQVREAHADGVRVVPWTVNDLDDCLRLIDWGVDGVATDYPDRLAEWLRERGIAF